MNVRATQYHERIHLHKKEQKGQNNRRESAVSCCGYIVEHIVGAETGDEKGLLLYEITKGKVRMTTSIVRRRDLFGDRVADVASFVQHPQSKTCL